MIVDTFGLTINGVADPGVVNQERIVIRPMRPINLGDYFLGVGFVQPDGSVLPIQNVVYWFPQAFADPNDWVFLFTGRGTNSRTVTSDGLNPALVYHWGRSTVLFSQPNVYPFIMQRGGVVVGHQIR